MLSTLLIRLKRVDSAGRHAQAGQQRQGGGDEDGDEIGDQLEAVVGHPSLFGWPVQ
jgi:hypothetical protein